MRDVGSVVKRNRTLVDNFDERRRFEHIVGDRPFYASDDLAPSSLLAYSDRDFNKIVRVSVSN